ncbi:MAG TPA: hypothetical protein VJL89_09420 [Thermodesulfovibrionia bacterium]|nr:hypothetical protein [Thermodesulfovibrionia bacterium]
MNWAHIHLMTNHFPVIGTLFGMLLLGFAMLRKSDELKKVSFGVFAIIALITFVVFFSGEPAEEIVEELPGVKESLIEEHEEMALISLIFVEILGVMSAIGLFASSRLKVNMKWFVTALFLLSVITSGLFGLTANLGGQIRHTEIRKDYNASPSDSEHEQKSQNHHEEDDDDD